MSDWLKVPGHTSLEPELDEPELDPKLEPELEPEPIVALDVVLTLALVSVAAAEVDADDDVVAVDVGVADKVDVLVEVL